VSTEPATIEVATQAPTVTTVRTPLFSPQASSHHGDEPESPAASPLLWTMLAAARRQFGEHRTGAAPVAAASSTVQTAAAPSDASTSIPGLPNEPVVVGANGTIYQVTTDKGSFRVSIVDSAGQVLTTTDAFAGTPNIYSQGVARPDGSLVIVTSNERGNRSTAWAVDSQGTVTKIATFTGSPQGKPTVGAGGALYVDTYIPTIFNPLGAADYRRVRISPTNTVRTFPTNTTVTLAPDGSAYLLSTQFGVRTLHAFGADGATTTILLPYEKDGRTPVIGGDGNAYLPVAVRTPFGGKTTRLYTFTGASSTTRTLAGLPGGTVVTADGVYLETYTYPGSQDNHVDGTTNISKITADKIATPVVIDGRLASFQVTPAGTIYATIYDPSLDVTQVAVVDSNGTRSTATLPGTPPQYGAVNRILGDGPQTDNHGYVSYTASGSTYLAVLNPDGSLDRTITLPAGTVPGPVFFGPDGAAYQISQSRQLGTAATTQVLLTLANDTFSPVLPGPALVDPGISDIQFGPDGGGYLIVRNDPSIGNQIRGFDAAGLTGVELTLTKPVVTPYGFYPVQELVFGPNGTAYVASGASDDAGVYALTTSGVTKVLDLDGTPPPLYPPVVGPDGTVYVTTATGNSSDGFVTTVKTIAPPVVV
jgi:sugar lactone lactonase YvrE